MYNQMSAMQEELQVRRSEAIDLKSNMAVMQDNLEKYNKMEMETETKVSIL